MAKNLSVLFTKLGISKNEAKVYVTLVEFSYLTANEISKKIKVPRTTVYGFLQQLIDKGLISKTINKSKTVFFVNEPKESLNKFVSIEKEKIKEKEESAIELVDFLTPYFAKNDTKLPKVRIFEGKTAIENMLEYYEPKWRQSYKDIGEDTMWGFQDHKFVDEYKKWHDKSWNYEDNREKIKLFSTKEGYAQQKRDKIENREIKLLPKGYDFKSSIWIHGEYVIMGIIRTDPHQAILIHDSVISNNLKTVFQILWNLS